MGRTSVGWRLRQRVKGGVYLVRFWCGGSESERSTGTRDPVEAAREASRIYADAISRDKPRRKQVRTFGFDLEECIAQWLVSLSATHDAKTLETWEVYATAHWVPHFSAIHHITDAGCAEYMRARLGKVLAQTVRKELTALRQFCRWLLAHGALAQEVNVPGIGKRVTGTLHERRSRSPAIPLSPDETEAILAHLPEWSESKKVARFPIRARFIVGYETSIRPETLDRLEAGVHYRSGSSTIMLTAELDKNRWAREVPLSERARAVLDSVCPEEGLIFGKHDYRPHLRAAAEATLPPGRSKLFNGAHLRSACITHRLEQTGNLPGVQFLAGHKLTSTTSAYVRPSLRAALDVVRQGDRSAKRPRRSAKR